MKTAVSIAGLVAGLTSTATSTVALADVKNVGGLVCMHYSSSEAPKSAEYVTYGGKLCNDSSTERLRVTCPLTQDLGTGATVGVTFDYVNWNPNGINGNQSTHPEEEFLCTVLTRTRYAQAAYWGEWQSAAEFPGWGDTPTAMYASGVPMQDDGFTHAVCYIPRKYGSDRSCVSHLRYNEQ